MMDRTLPWISLAMQLNSLENLPEYPLPEEYGWRFFRQGDELAWARIEISAGEFQCAEAAMEKFRRYYPTDDGLDARMIFLTDHGVPFATANAWHGDPDAASPEGRLHWVAVDAGHQGRRLSYPLVSLALRRMRQLGHIRATLTTQTASWPAIKVYRAFGFRPLLRAPEETQGWRLVSEKTGIDFMNDLV